jgi:hypothetical protein
MANTITATITDLDGNAWAAGTYVISFIPSASVPQMAGQTVYSGSLDSNGAFSVSLPTASWNFAVLPNASQGGFSSVQAITATASLTAVLSALAFGPRFGAGPNAFGYADAEVILPVSVGQSYFNVTSNVIRTWNGSAWQTGGNSGSVTTVSVVSANGFSGSVATATTTPAVTLSQTRFEPTVLYSAAGTALPAASSGLKGQIAVVSDATTPTYLGTYTSGGAVVCAVICNGTAWVTM